MNSRRAVPVKMIWMFVCMSLAMMAFISMAVIYPSMRVGFFRTVFSTFTTAALLCVGAGVCLSRGCVNLSLPGTATLSALLCAGLCNTGMGLAPAILLTALAGSVLGAINGLFALQGRRSVPLVTGLTTLLTGAIFSAVANVVTNGAFVKMNESFHATTPLILIGLALTLTVCFLGAIGGKSAFATNTVDAASSGGAGRFVWMTVSGLLAAFAGAFQATYMATALPSMFSNYNLYVIFPTLVIAGILIPNARRSAGEAIFGLLAVAFAALAYAFLQFTSLSAGLPSYTFYLIHCASALPFMIPNLLIYRKLGGDAAPAAEDYPIADSRAWTAGDSRTSDGYASNSYGSDSFERTVPRADGYPVSDDRRYANASQPKSSGWDDGEKTVRVQPVSEDDGEKTVRM